jgi:hypothetical protein
MRGGKDRREGREGEMGESLKRKWHVQGTVLYCAAYFGSECICEARQIIQIPR